MKFISSKKGFFMSARDWLSFFVGAALTIMGLIPLLNKLGVIKFNLPAFMLSFLGSIAVWIIAIAGVYILIDGMIEPAGHGLHIFLMILGLLFVIVGLIPILNNAKILPFGISFLKNLIVYNAIIVVEGAMLMTAGFTMR